MNERIVRFRAWDKTQKVMRHVITSIDWLIDGRPIRVHWCTSEIEDGVILDFDFILFQFTGLYDHSDKPIEVYDQDVMSGIDPSSGRTVRAIVYQGPDGKWSLQDVSNKTAAYSLKNTLLGLQDLTVIGNTKENPELVKEVRK